MKKLLPLIIALVLGGQGLAAQSVLDSLITSYVAAIQPAGVEEKQAECDFLIGSVRDSSLRRHIALSLFDQYREAPVMGDEAVAIYLYDKYFASGDIAMRSEFDLLDAQLFADFNRSSLIGMDAPLLTLYKPCRGRLTVPAKGASSVLWFYDTSCSKCVMESKILPGLLEKEVHFPLTLYAVYSGRDRKAWREFRRSFKVGGGKVRVVHLWDPDNTSDYIRKYGVISTPRMFAVAPSGGIIGRRLEVESLLQLLPVAEELDALRTF